MRRLATGKTEKMKATAMHNVKLWTARFSQIASRFYLAAVAVAVVAAAATVPPLHDAFTPWFWTPLHDLTIMDGHGKGPVCHTLAKCTSARAGKLQHNRI